jgi:hypothetical protein
MVNGIDVSTVAFSQKKELPRFLRFSVLSGVGWVLDTLVLLMLIAWGVSPFWGGLIGALVGAAFAFSSSVSRVFDAKLRGYIFTLFVYLLYTLALAYLIAISIALLSRLLAVTLSSLLPAVIIAFAAKVLTTPLTLLANYLVARKLIQTGPK